MADVVIREADASDAGTVVGLIRELAIYEGLLDQVRIEEADVRRDGFGERRHFECLIAEVDGEAAGFALFFHNYSTFEGRPGIYLEDIFVRDSARSLGLGRKLMARLPAARPLGPALEPRAGLLPPPRLPPHARLAALPPRRRRPATARRCELIPTRHGRGPDRNGIRPRAGRSTAASGGVAMARPPSAIAAAPASLLASTTWPTWRSDCRGRGRSREDDRAARAGRGDR